MIKEAGINFNALEPEDHDSPFGEYTGAGTIFELPEVLQKRLLERHMSLRQANL